MRHRTQQRHKQALPYGSASPFTSLCNPLHGPSFCHTSNPPKPRIRVFPVNSRDQNMTSIKVSHVTRSQSILIEPSESDKFRFMIPRQLLSSRQNQNQNHNHNHNMPFEPSESFDNVQPYFQHRLVLIAFILVLLGWENLPNTA